ncbi:recombinase family protein [Carboxylicivirga caseinilyticus]|uniref:recombinase family protein n=1 Tax=Carboxylicivirga caseinilyticus TaxID=3417572 RepID=UPI003D33BB3A|nr:recombinase family protein [Marinilabiliaceae bacterium A049]
MKKGVIYGRVSSKDQDYTRQVTELKQWAASFGVTIEETFLEKISATKTKADERKELQKMLKYTERHNIKNVFCWELSRLGRRNKDVIKIFEDLTSKKVCLWIKKDNLITLDDNGNKTTTATLMINVLSALAEMETEQLSTRTISGKMEKAKKGGGFNGCYGYDIVEGKPVVNKEQAKDIATIFNMLAEGIGCRSIAAHLNATTALKRWRNPSIYTIARNTMYKGERRYKGLVLEAPSIIDSELWQKANDKIDLKDKYVGNKIVNTNILIGKIFCKKCGSPMYQVVNEKQGTNVYRCSSDAEKKKESGTKCRISISRPWLYHVVRHHFDKYAEKALQEETRSKLERKISLNNAEIENHEKDRKKLADRLKRARLLFVDGELSDSEYKEIKGDSSEEIKNIDVKILSLKDENTSFNKSISGEVGHFSKDDTIFKEQIKDILKEVIVWDKFVEVNIDGWFKEVYFKPTPEQVRKMKADNNWQVRCYDASSFYKDLSDDMSI